MKNYETVMYIKCLRTTNDDTSNNLRNNISMYNVKLLI